MKLTTSIEINTLEGLNLTLYYVFPLNSYISYCQCFNTSMKNYNALFKNNSREGTQSYF